MKKELLRCMVQGFQRMHTEKYDTFPLSCGNWAYFFVPTIV